MKGSKFDVVDDNGKKLRSVKTHVKPLAKVSAPSVFKPQNEVGPDYSLEKVALNLDNKEAKADLESALDRFISYLQKMREEIHTSDLSYFKSKQINDDINDCLYKIC